MPPLTQIKDAEADLSYVNYVEEALSQRQKELFSMQKADAFGFVCPRASVCVGQELKANLSSLMPLNRPQHGNA
jgi:hypothetical protein